MRVLVTGGAGFIGSHLCDRLIQRGDEVLCLDNFFTGTRSNVAHLRDHPNFELIRHSVIDPISLEVERIFHLACPASPVHYQADAIQTIKTSVLGTLNMLDLAHRLKARILLASTSEIYGDPLEHPQTETYWGNVNPIGIRSCYDESKRMAETLMFDYHRQHKVDIRVMRIFNTYGPRMNEHDGRVVSNFICQALRGKSLTIYGEGQQTRSFCYVDDNVEGMLRLMDGDHIGPINIGNPNEFTIMELAQKVLSLVNADVPIEYHPLPSDDPRQRKPDITRAQTFLDWEPKVPLEEGLERTIADFRARLLGK